MTALETMARIAHLAESSRLNLTHEISTQAQLDAVLRTDGGFTVERERVLSERDKVDFLVDGIAVEVKIKGSKTAIYRQLARYAEHDCVKGILLVSNVAMGLPSEINGKPARIASLGVGWL